MEEGQPLVMEPFNDAYVIVYGNKEKLDPLLSVLKGKWQAKLKAWLVPKEYERKIEKMCSALANNTKLTSMSKVVKKRKEQKRYRRAVSEEDESPSTPERRQITKPIQEILPQPNEALSVDVQTLLMSESSDSEEEGSSDSDFPESKSPRNYEREYKQFSEK